MKKAHYNYFGVKLRDRDKSLTFSLENLKPYRKGEHKCLEFGVAMVWRDQINYFDDCFFCYFIRRFRNEINFISA